VNFSIIPASLARMLYNILLISSGLDDSQPSLACVELGIEGTSSSSTQALFFIHDLFYPLFLLLFSSVVFYWYDLQASLGESLAKARNLKFMNKTTLTIFISLNGLFTAFYVIFDLLLASDFTDKDIKSSLARSQLLIIAIVFLVEAVFYVFAAYELYQVSGGGEKLKKIRNIAAITCTVHILLSIMLVLFSVGSSFMSELSGVSFSILYSVVVKVLEGVVVVFLSNSLSSKKKKSATSQASSPTSNSSRKNNKKNKTTGSSKINSSTAEESKESKIEMRSKVQSSSIQESEIERDSIVESGDFRI